MGWEKGVEAEAARAIEGLGRARDEERAGDGESDMGVKKNPPVTGLRKKGLEAGVGVGE